MTPPRISNRVAWDHTVLVGEKGRVTWNPQARIDERRRERVRPVGLVAWSWVLSAWSLIASVALLVRQEASAHVSMRLLMRGALEEAPLVAWSAMWVVGPGIAAFLMARWARIVSIDDLGARVYRVSIAVMVLGAIGLSRPMWDPGAGSWIARQGPAAVEPDSVGAWATPLWMEPVAVSPGAEGEDAAASALAAESSETTETSGVWTGSRFRAIREAVRQASAERGEGGN